jgi:hypothetical protein
VENIRQIATGDLAEETLRFHFDERLGEAGTRLFIPNSTIIGYIPFLRSVSGTPARSVYRKLRWRPAFHFLFRSGNPVPPVTMDPEVSLADFLRLRHFRAVLWIRNIVLENDRGGSRISLKHGHKVGYTPLMGGIFLPGAGTLTPEVTLSYGRLTITVILRFKLGKLANFGSGILTGHLAPSAWIQTRYSVWSSGLCELQFTGSSIPSQKIYVDIREIFHHDMLSTENNSIMRFIRAGNCTNAPNRIFPFVLPWMVARPSPGDGGEDGIPRD